MFLAEASCAATLVSVMTLHLMDDNKKKIIKKNIKNIHLHLKERNITRDQNVIAAFDLGLLATTQNTLADA